jgi:hypothetical protein
MGFIAAAIVILISLMGQAPNEQTPPKASTSTQSSQTAEAKASPQQYEGEVGLTSVEGVAE